MALPPVAPFGEAVAPQNINDNLASLYHSYVGYAIIHMRMYVSSKRWQVS